ncbi:phospholipase D-like domain-containing protein [Plantactinospora soyae]|uniref:phospholipase D n=1 Tax=Plantactinospora soyae TaxID=1544732 RepID=A0A927ME25_9ACTN|nr:phospholipase D-like domain-containing protein [Plantactinospora soyae]MBE1491421.1 HKD family nuclease [Plantactinospora soyae]
MFLRRTVGSVAAAALLLAGLVLPSAPAAGAVASGAVFNNPTVAAEQYRIVDHVRGLVQGAPAGSTISIAMYHWTSTTVADDIVAAHNRGVNVRLVLDYLSEQYPAVDTMRAALGTNRANRSWLTFCTQGAACIGNAGSPIMHNKFYLFSSTSGSANVVVQSSANLTVSNATAYWNNAVTLVGNTGLYTAYLDYFDDLAAKAKNSDYYRTVGSGNAKAYFFPRAGSDKTSDTIYNMLNENVTCEGNTTVGTETGRTMIRIGMWYFSRNGIAEELRALADQKCWIEVVYTTMDADVLSILSGHPRIVLYRIGGDHIVHSKYMLIEGTYAGTRNSKWVMTGSHNYTTAALRENDEALLRIESAPIHDQYRSNFWALRAAAS